MHPVKRKHRLNKAEKILILMANEYFKAETKAGLDPLHRTARERVAKCLNFAPSTVQVVIREWKTHGEGAFDDSSDDSVDPAPVFYEVEIRSYVPQCNLRMEPCTSKKVQKHLQDVTGKPISARTVRRWLKRLRLRFVKGKKRNHYAESTGVIFLWVEYPAKKSHNMTRHNNSRKPEVFLDESYINENHTTEKTWLDQGKDRMSQSGKGPRLVIIAAGVIYLKNEFRAIGSREWTNAYRHAQSYERRYAEEQAASDEAAAAAAENEDALPDDGGTAEDDDDEEAEEEVSEPAPIDLLEDREELIKGQMGSRVDYLTK